MIICDSRLESQVLQAVGNAVIELWDAWLRVSTRVPIFGDESTNVFDFREISRCEDAAWLYYGDGVIEACAFVYPANIVHQGVMPVM